MKRLLGLLLLITSHASLGLAFHSPFPRQIRGGNGVFRRQGQLLRAAAEHQPAWLVEGNMRGIKEVVTIDVKPPRQYGYMELLELRDKYMKKHGRIPEHLLLLSIDKTIEQLTKRYRFPASLLGRWVMLLGVQPPIKKTVPIRELVGAEGQHMFMRALHTDDVMYNRHIFSNPNVLEVVQGYEGAVTLDDAFEICRQYDLMLPFGAESILPKDEHEVLIRELNRLCERKKYQLRPDGWPEAPHSQSLPPPQQAQIAPFR